MIDYRNSKADVVAEILKARGIEDVEGFLFPSTSNLCAFEEFEFIDKGYHIVDNAIKNNKSILIYADVDTDGIMSAAIMYRYLRNFTRDVVVHINDNREHGVLDSFETDADLIIVVDSINDTVDKYLNLLDSGKEIIVLDHHIPNQEVFDIREKICLISSAVNYSNKDLSGAGVCWKFCEYLDIMRGESYNHDLIHLAAVGIVGDVCSMRSMENRAICSRAFMTSGMPLALGLILGDKKYNCESIAFSISPFINSAIRLGYNEDILAMFLSTNGEDVKKYYNKLSGLKDKQREIVNEFMKSVDETSQKNNEVYIFYNDNYENFNGLFASNLVEKFHKPVFVGKVKDGIFYGSMRCPYNVDYREIINKTGIAVCNGHERSAGVHFAIEDINNLISFLNYFTKEIDKEVTEEADILVNDNQITDNFVANIERINMISGEGFKPVIVKVAELKDFAIQWIKNVHLKLNKGIVNYIKWGAKNEPIDIKEGDVIDVVGTPYFNFFAGRWTIQFIINNLNNSETEGVAMIF